MANATVARNLVPVRATYREGYGHYLTIDCPEGWDDVKKLCKKVLQFEGRNYTYRGWNSDRNECFFHADGAQFATIKH